MVTFSAPWNRRADLRCFIPLENMTVISFTRGMTSLRNIRLTAEQRTISENGRHDMTSAQRSGVREGGGTRASEVHVNVHVAAVLCRFASRESSSAPAERLLPDKREFIPRGSGFAAISSLFVRQASKGRAEFGPWTTTGTGFAVAGAPKNDESAASKQPNCSARGTWAQQKEICQSFW